MKIVQNDLDKFYKRLQNIDIGSEFANRVAEKIIDKGVQIANEKYAGTNVIVDKSQIVDGKGYISASGKQVAYDEFGTGILGQSSGYEGNLPTQLIEFESPKASATRPGVPQKTQGWEYAYRNKQYGTPAIQGRIAQKRMWKTEQDLIAYINSDLKKDIKGN